MPRSAAAILVAAAACALGGCGSDAPAPEEEVRATLDRFTRATRAKDYGTLCDDVLDRGLTAEVERIGLPCEVSLQKALGQVRQPRLVIGRIRVTGARASAEIRTSAAGQRPSTDTIELVKRRAGWRVTSLAGGGAQASATPEAP